MNGEHEVGHGRVFAGEDKVFFDELYPHAFAGEKVDENA